ncbi:hypothetical protein [Sphingomonas sp.]|uniref:hypothetical protein n=1 Tax=Sphingomonas sp. TaxID=28214 RepID=UPI0035C86D32
MFSITIALALAAAGVGLSDDTSLYCVRSDQTLQNIRTADDINAASPKLIDADLGRLEAAMLQQLGLRGSIGVTGERTGLLTFRVPARATETITYSIRREEDGIALVSMRVRLKGVTEDLRGDNMCWRTFGIINVREGN